MERKVYHQFWNDVAHIRTKAREVGNQRAYVSKEEKMKLSVKTFVQLFILGTCWTIVYALPFIQYILYDPLLEQLGCSNTQLGLLMTIFGLGNIFGAPVGG